MLSILKLKQEAYLIAIHQFLTEVTGNKMSLTSIHQPLSNLEKNGLIRSGFGEATAIRGGRRKKVYSLTPLGHERLAQNKKIIDMMWQVYGEYVPDQGI